MNSTLSGSIRGVAIASLFLSSPLTGNGLSSSEDPVLNAKRPMPIVRPATKSYDGGARLADDNGVWELVTAAPSRIQLPKMVYSQTTGEPGNALEYLRAPSISKTTLSAKLAMLNDLATIQEITGLPESRLSDLLGFSRPTINSWKNLGNSRESNQKKVNEVAALLRFLQGRYPNQQELLDWLFTEHPVISKRPADLLAEGNLDQVRMLAVLASTSTLKTSAPASSTQSPWREALESPNTYWFRDDEA